MCDPCELIELEYGTDIKTEAVDDHEIKMEPVDTFENTTDDNDTASSNSIRSSRGKFSCDICHNFFNNNNDFIIHKYISHTEKPYTCKICNAKFNLRAHLNIHISDHVDYIHMKESSLETDIQLSSTSNLKLDLNKLKSSVKLTRNVYQEVLQERSSVQNCYVPLKSTMTRKSFKCPNCNFVTMSEAKFSHHQSICNHIPTSSETHNSPNSCKLCTRTFINRTALNGHMRYHSLRGEIISKRKNALKNRMLNDQNENNFVHKSSNVRETESVTNGHKCKDCNKKFITYNKLNIHQLQHKKQMMCNLCNKQFFLKKSFEKHLLFHKRYKIASDQQELEESVQHKSLHTQMFNNINNINPKKKKKLLITIKPYQCSYCKQFYSTERSLGEHIRQFHIEMKPVYRSFKLESTKCNWCNAIITKANLFRHVKSLHPEVDPVKCSYCFMSFKDFPSMKSHISECQKN